MLFELYDKRIEKKNAYADQSDKECQASEL
jgi:hypothetical protein